MDFTNIIDSLGILGPYAIYVAIMLAPFIQEDLAVLAAAGLSATGQTELVPTVLAIFAGLFFSDIWKYWIGWAALNNKKGAAFSKQEKVMALKEKVVTYPFSAMMTARFVPLTRIPAYIAAGFFKVNYAKFCIYIAITAILYIAMFFSVFHLLGELMAEKLKWVLPIIGLSFAAVMVGMHLRGRNAGK